MFGKSGCCFDIPPRAQLFKKSASIPDSRAERNNDEVGRALNQCYYPQTVKGGHIWCLGSSPSISVELSIQDEAMNVARFAT